MAVANTAISRCLLEAEERLRRDGQVIFEATVAVARMTPFSYRSVHGTFYPLFEHMLKDGATKEEMIEIALYCIERDFGPLYVLYRYGMRDWKVMIRSGRTE